jgi:4-carboxymuconolactone decarboxylase
MVTLACLVSNQSYELYENVLKIALDIGVTPIEIKELLYQSIVYIGLSKLYKFIKITNELFVENNIILPLDSQIAVDYDERLLTGYNIQANNFGKDFIDSSIENCPDNQKHIWDFISSYAYGDFYTRSGLTEKQRELLSFTYIMSLRGCEDQLRIHTKGNLNIGNDKETLISVITVLVPYLGFPRVHNALKILNEVCDEV